MHIHQRPALFWGLAYGGLGFAVGFVFGALRETVLIPAFGERAGHLLEFPLVTASVAAIGIWLGRRAHVPALAVGLLGVLVLVALESTMALAIFRTSLADYLAQYDVTRGALFPAGLVVMAAAPWLGAKR
jgi:hypothetical protein